MGLLAAAELAPKFLVGLLAGVWADRLRRRPLMIAADLGRAVVLASVPLAALLGVLRIEQLYVVALLAGVLTVLFDVAYQAYLPVLVGRAALVEGNSRLTASASVAEFSGFSLGGWLVQWFTAPLAILIDALTFLWSALWVGRIRAPEPPPAPAAERTGLRLELAEGFRAVLSHPVRRALAGCGVTVSLSMRVYGTVILLFCSRELGFSPGVLGTVFAVGGFTSFLGALGAAAAGRRLGLGRAMIAGLFLSGVGSLFNPLAPGATAVGLLFLVLAQVVTDPAHTVFDIHQTSLLQSVTPDHLLGRVNGTIRFLEFAAGLLGTVVGGLLGEHVGLRATMFLAAGTTVLAVLWLVLSPVGRIGRTGEAVPTGSTLPSMKGFQSSRGTSSDGE